MFHRRCSPARYSLLPPVRGRAACPASCLAHPATHLPHHPHTLPDRQQGRASSPRRRWVAGMLVYTVSHPHTRVFGHSAPPCTRAGSRAHNPPLSINVWSLIFAWEMDRERRVGGVAGRGVGCVGGAHNHIHMPLAHPSRGAAPHRDSLITTPWGVPARGGALQPATRCCPIGSSRVPSIAPLLAPLAPYTSLLLAPPPPARCVVHVPQGPGHPTPASGAGSSAPSA